jgi:pyruvate/2-oxoglutarate dehydrogenase complex dihydrolipoamide dehydrogenase (E3) component
MMRTGNIDAFEQSETVTVITGPAAFLDPHTVGVGVGDDRITVSADTILINTGSEPIVPDVPGLADSRYVVTSTELIESTTLPGRLAIVGGGYLGIEFASIYRGFGLKVTVLEPHRRSWGTRTTTSPPWPRAS